MSKIFTLFVLFFYLLLPNTSSADWITKKSNNNEKLTEIDQMYKDGYLSKIECVTAKEKILNSKDYRKTNCDNVKVKKFITKKEKEKKPSAKPKKEVDPKTWRAEVSHPLTDEIFKSKIITKNKKEAINDALDLCYRFLNKNHYRKYQELVSDCKISKTYQIGKETKIAKKPDSTLKKEYIPQETSQDNEAPIIEIAETITVNDTFYVISGTVTDKSDKIFVSVDNRPIEVKGGVFKVKRFSPVNEELSLVAIDKWGNKSKPKKVKIIVDIQDKEVAKSIEPLDPSRIKSKPNRNKVAVIFGISDYKKTPAAAYANNDAKFFYEYSRKAFGIPKSNIKLLVDEQANLVESLGVLNKWLPSKIKQNETDLIIFFAGHGLASSDGKELYILPQDSDPDLLSRTALSRTELFEEILNLNPKSVTMFMDTCYSGISRDEKLLLASARPVRISTSSDGEIPNNFTIFSASELNQISSGLEEAKHGIFSYYLMKGLEGKADANNDRKITNSELIAYMDTNVSEQASFLNRKQNPTLSGDPNKVLVTY